MKITITTIIEIDDKDLEKIKSEERKEESKDTTITKPSIYTRLFNEDCTGWTNDLEYNVSYLKHVEQNANNILRKNGHLFLNEVFDMLGFPRIKDGNIVGWIYDKSNPIGDNYVDFGICKYDLSISDSTIGFNNNILLVFNVDGNILDKIES